MEGASSRVGVVNLVGGIVDASNASLLHIIVIDQLNNIVRSTNNLLIYYALDVDIIFLVSEAPLVVVYGDDLLVLLLGANFHAQEGGEG